MNKKQLNQFVDTSKVKENNKSAYIERMSMVSPKEFVDTYLQYCPDEKLDEMLTSGEKVDNTFKKVNLIKILFENRKSTSYAVVKEFRARLTENQFVEFLNLIVEYGHQKGFEDGFFADSYKFY